MWVCWFKHFWDHFAILSERLFHLPLTTWKPCITARRYPIALLPLFLLFKISSCIFSNLSVVTSKQKTMLSATVLELTTVMAPYHSVVWLVYLLYGIAFRSTSLEENTFVTLGVFLTTSSCANLRTSCVLCSYYLEGLYTVPPRLETFWFIHILNILIYSFSFQIIGLLFRPGRTVPLFCRPLKNFTEFLMGGL